MARSRILKPEFWSDEKLAGRFREVPPDLVEKWQQAYPAVDVLSELRRMEAWASANPVNRKSNWQRFIVNWLTRAQEESCTVLQTASLPWPRGKGRRQSLGLRT